MNVRVSANLLVWFILEGIAFAGGIFVYGDSDCPEIYASIWILPFCFMLISIVLIPVLDIIFSRVSLLIIYFFYYFRMVILPVLMSLGNYHTFIPDTYLEMMNPALLLMIYEALVVFVFILIVTYELRNTNRPIEILFHERTRFPKRFKWLVFVLCAFIILLILRDMSLLRSNFLLIIGTNKNWKIEPSYVRLGSNGKGTLGIFVTLMNIFFWIIQVIVPPYLVYFICKKIANKKVTMFLSLLVIAVTLLVATETRAHSIECALGLAFTLLCMTNFDMKKLFPFCILAFVIVFYFGLTSKSGVTSKRGVTLLSEGFFEQISKVISSYFSGPQNVAAGMYTCKVVPEMNIFTCIQDVCLRIPFFRSIALHFFSYTSNDYFNMIISNAGKSTGQIFPLICQGYEYFSFALAPILPCVCVYLSIHSEAKARNSNNIIYKNCMYVFTIIFARMLMVNLISGVGTIFYVFFTYYVANRSVPLAEERSK